MQKITVKGPASSANLGPGFDTFAIAIDGIYDTVSMTLEKQKGIRIKIKNGRIPSKAEENTGGLVASNIFTEFGISGGCTIEIQKGVPAGYGLGSSAATASAVAYGLDKLLDLKLNSSELLAFAASGEVASAGVSHYDNVAGSLFGGFVVVRSAESIDVVSFAPPKNLGICIAVPKISTPPKKTGKARAMLPKSVSLVDMIHNLSSASMMVAAFAKGDVDLIGKAMSDKIVEPARESLVPGYQEVRRMTLKAGASGTAISGAGPSMIAFVNLDKVKSARVAGAMKDGFAAANVNSEIIITKIGKGASVLKQ
ncbi:MAG: homoserine kinase [Thaumarchaeota archaeon]|nr:homoserine kinase [Nitrososphaerota archaeon]